MPALSLEQRYLTKMLLFNWRCQQSERVSTFSSCMVMIWKPEISLN